ncbi:MAG: DUF5131 family protein [Micavibrio sp.]
MADKSGIEWTDATWNPLAGCSIVSAGCTNCYAMKQAARLLDKPGSHYEGTTKKVNGNAVWTGKVSLAPDHIITQPLHWKRPRRIFVNSMSDLFHESVPNEWIDRIFAIMALCPHHIFQVLTKRPERMREYFEKNFHPHHVAARADKYSPGCHDEIASIKFPLKNVWLGVSVEDQASANKRIPFLMDTPAAVRFLSCEPLLESVNLERIVISSFPRLEFLNAFDGWKSTKISACTFGNDPTNLKGIDWVIVGGESGPGTRAMHPDWVRSLRDQCTAASVPFFFKQWGEFSPVYDRDNNDTDWRKCSEIECQNQPGRWMNLEGGHGFHGDRVHYMKRTGKKAAGRLLDGQTWDQFPEALK